MDEFSTNALEDRVLVLAPLGRDAPLLCRAISADGMRPAICATMPELCDELRRGAGVLLIAEESLARGNLDSLADALGRQPDWSEVPLIVLTGRARGREPAAEPGLDYPPWRQALNRAALLERPTRIRQLRSVARAALFWRHRQYELRARLAGLQSAESELTANNRVLEDRVREQTAAWRLVCDVAAAANRAKTAAAAVRYALRRIAIHYGWSFGCLWRIDPERPGTLVSGKVFYEQSPGRFRALRKTLRGMTLHAGPSVVNRALEDGHTHSTMRIRHDLETRSIDAELARGTRFLVAAPVYSNGQNLGVLEFFSDRRTVLGGGPLATLRSIGAHLGEVASREQASREQEASEQRFRAVFDHSAIGVCTIDPQGCVLSANPAAQALFRRGQEELAATPLIDLVHPEDRPKVNRQRSLLFRGFQSGYEIELRYRPRDGDEFWAREIASAAPGGPSFERHAIVMIQNITERQQLDRHMAQIVTAQQQMLGQELHDGVGQVLTGMGFLAKALQQRLAASGLSEADAAGELVELAQSALAQVRAVQGAGLPAALAELAECCSRRFQVDCRCQCDPTAGVVDDQTAIHLFRIAQEATTNAVRHAGAKNINVQLHVEKHQILLEIQNDGAGFAPAALERGGSGLRIMQHRASAMGATLTIQPVETGGTLVTCTLNPTADRWKNENPSLTR
jgi:two-component system, LuxR family, sensor kinase FixL